MPVIKSSLPDVEIPEVPLQNFVFSRFKKYGDRTALIDGISGAKYSYNDLTYIRQRLSSSLARLGVKQRDVVALMTVNCPEFFFMFFGVLSTGAIVTTINPIYTKYETLHQVEQCDIRFLFVEQAHVQTAKEVARETGKIQAIIVLGHEEGCVSFIDLLKADEHAPHIPEVTCTPRDDVSVILSSSGTTGLPKGVMLTHYNIVANICQNLSPYVLYHSMGHQTLLCVLPLFHSYALTVLMCCPLASGQTIVTLPAFTPDVFLSAIERFKINHAYVVPPIIVRLLQGDRLQKYDVTSLQLVHSGGAPFGEGVEAEFRKKLPHLSFLVNGYGLTETSPSLSGSDRSGRNKPGSSGVLFPNTELKIIDVETGNELSAHAHGEVVVRGPQIMKGYLNNPEATREAIDPDGWFRTGDIGYYDEDGYLYIVDRIKELIKYKGFQVAPAELENVLLSHPGVGDAAVVGLQDPRGAGELPKAFIVLHSGAKTTAQELHEFVAEKLAHYKQLRGGIEFLDHIPKSNSGKILRRVLRDRVNTRSKL